MRKLRWNENLRPLCADTAVIAPSTASWAEAWLRTSSPFYAATVVATDSLALRVQAPVVARHRTSDSHSLAQMPNVWINPCGVLLFGIRRNFQSVARKAL